MTFRAGRARRLNYPNTRVAEGAGLPLPAAMP